MADLKEREGHREGDEDGEILSKTLLANIIQMVLISATKFSLLVLNELGNHVKRSKDIFLLFFSFSLIFVSLFLLFQFLPLLS